MDLVRTAIPPGPLWQGASVLVVDDEVPIRGIVRGTLQIEGFHVEEAEDGRARACYRLGARGTVRSYPACEEPLRFPVLDDVAPSTPRPKRWTMRVTPQKRMHLTSPPTGIQA
jgi:hypothetical protein